MTVKQTAGKKATAASGAQGLNLPYAALDNGEVSPLLNRRSNFDMLQPCKTVR